MKPLILVALVACQITIARIPDPNPAVYRMEYTDAGCEGKPVAAIFRVAGGAQEEVKPHYGPGAREVWFDAIPGVYDVHVCIGPDFGYHRAVVDGPGPVKGSR